MVRFAALVIGLTLYACSPPETAERPEPSAAEQAVHPVSGLPLITVTVDTGERRIDFVTELANSPEAQEQGLMFRTKLGEFEGMLFPSQTPQARSFWMKNTPLPLDIIFVAPDGRIANIEGGVPYSTDSVASDGPAAAVFEIRGGRAAALGIEPGDLVEWEAPE